MASSDTTRTSATLYDLLNVSPNATYDEIRASYHAAVRCSHPDKDGRDSTLFLAQQQAWETLRDDSLRSKYDITLTACIKVNRGTRILEEVLLDETDGTAMLCRCGGYAPIDISMGFPQVIACDWCSLQYRISSSTVTMSKPSTDD